MDKLLLVALILGLVGVCLPLILGLVFTLVMTDFLGEISYLAPLEIIFVFFVLTAFCTVVIAGLIHGSGPKNPSQGGPGQRP